MEDLARTALWQRENGRNSSMQFYASYQSQLLTYHTNSETANSISWTLPWTSELHVSQAAMATMKEERAERRLEKVMFDDIGLPDDSDCLLEAFEGNDRTANILRHRYQKKGKAFSSPAPVPIKPAETAPLKPLLPSVVFNSNKTERPSWADMSTDSEDEDGVVRQRSIHDLSSSQSLCTGVAGESWSSRASAPAEASPAPGGGLPWNPLDLESFEMKEEQALDTDRSTGDSFSWAKVWEKMNSGKSECSSPVSSISAQEMAVGYKAQQMMIVQPAETRGLPVNGLVQQMAQPSLMGGQVQIVQPVQPVQPLQPMVMMIPATTVQFSQGYYNTPEILERYCLRFTDGELSNADGVGIVFSSQLPCPQNIQKIVSVFANRTGRICMRADADVERSHVSIKALELGDWLEVTCDFDRRQVTFTVWPRDGGDASTATVDFSGGAERFRRLSAKIPQCASGYLAVVMKHPGLSEKGLPMPVRHDGCLDVSQIFPELLSQVTAAALPAFSALGFEGVRLRHAFRTKNYVSREETFARHVDKYAVTLNVCLLRTATLHGSRVFFYASEDTVEPAYCHEHQVGLAVAHSSKEWHQTEKLFVGERGETLACAGARLYALMTSWWIKPPMLPVESAWCSRRMRSRLAGFEALQLARPACAERPRPDIDIDMESVCIAGAVFFFAKQWHRCVALCRCVNAITSEQVDAEDASLADLLAPPARPALGISPATVSAAKTTTGTSEILFYDGVVLGKGAFGIVARGINKETGELVAIKRIAPTHKLAVATAKNEVEAATHLGEHPNVVQMKAYFLAPLEQGQGTREVILVYRLALGGDLQQWINQQHGNAFDVNYAQPKLTDEALRIMRQLVSGLQHIHLRGIQHRDLKPANILLSAGCTALIADFGIALVNRSSAREQGHAALGDFYFIDVDSLVTKELPYTRDDDVYSLGEVFVRILFGRYATGGDLRRFAEESPSELPPVVRILEQMLTSRDRRCPLSRVQEVLDELRLQPKPSEPRPIVFSIFLGIGAVMTARVLMEHLRKKKFRKQDMSVFSKRSNLKSSLQATFCVGQTQGRRPSLQDYYCHARIAWNVHKGARSWRLLGMFDGHGGKDCAKFAAQSLPHEVRRMLRETEAEAAGLEGLPLWRLASRGLQKALESLDRLYIKFRQKKNNMDLCGTTASVALLSPDGCHAVVSNIGDSRTGLVGEWKKLEHTGIGPESPSGLFMTHAHRVSDPLEMARIDAAGGFVEYGGSGHRVNGVLGVSRAIGYCGIKDYADLVPALSDNMIMERDGTKAGLVGLASDGLFRTCSEEEAESVFRRLAHADCYQSLEQLVSEELDIAGGGEAANNKDNASILACLLPPL
eukprot:s233_g10.t1